MNVRQRASKAPTGRSWSPYFKGQKDAGFAKAKGKRREDVTSITVQRSDNFLAQAMVWYWGFVAGWPILVFTDDPNPDIFIQEGGSSWCTWSSEPPYEHATIQFVTWAINPSFYGWTTGPHEGGHAIGFRHYRDSCMAGHHFAQRNDAKALEAAGYFVERG